MIRYVKIFLNPFKIQNKMMIYFNMLIKIENKLIIIIYN